MINIAEAIEKTEGITGIHPAAELFPLPDSEQFESLKRDIQEVGQVDPASIDAGGLLIDGRSRMLAAAELGIALRLEVVTVEPWHFSVSKNLARRHLTTGQIAAIGAGMVNTVSGGGGGVDLSVHMCTPSNQPPLIDRTQAAKLVGVSERSISSAKKVLDAGNVEQVAALKSGARAVRDLADEVRKAERRKAQEAKRNAPIPADRETVIVVTDKGQEATLIKPLSSKMNETNDSVGWAAFTWNPVTGCRHDCNFCYAREIAHSGRMAPFYPFKFEPTFLPHRLVMPSNTRVPDEAVTDPRLRRVFVCSMADLFGKWVPDDWIYQVFDACLASPQWEYLFLTKWPERYHRIGDRLIEGAWYGASVIKQTDVARTERTMQKFDNNVVRWVSLEPMLEPITFSNLDWCDLMVIGAQTSTSQPDGFVPEYAPPFEWVLDVIEQCREAGIPYHLKANLFDGKPGAVPTQMQPRIS